MSDAIRRWIIWSAQPGRLLLLLTVSFPLGTVAFSSSVPDSSEPTRRIDATELGFTPAYFESNREFFKRFTLARLAAADNQSKLLMLSEDMAVLYGTRPTDGIRNHPPDCLRAFFIEVSTGALLRKQEWHVKARRANSDLLDSEARMVALSGGRYLVVADGKIHVYAADWVLAKTSPLSEDMWAAKSVSGGDVVCLRHSQYPGKVAPVSYEWLNSRSLDVLRRFDDSNSVRVQMPFTATADSVTYELRDGLHELTSDGEDHIICADPMCNFPTTANWEVIGQRPRKCLVFVSMHGLLVAAVPWNSSWLRLTGYPGTGAASPYIFLIEVARDAGRFCLGVDGNHRSFDGVPLRGKWQYLVYDIASRRPVLVVPQFSVNGDVHVALSPSGKRLLTFDGRSIRVYDVP